MSLLDTPFLVVKTRILIGEIKGRILSVVQLHWNESLIFICPELVTRETVVSLTELCRDRCGALSHRCLCSSHTEGFGRGASWVCCLCRHCFVHRPSRSFPTSLPTARGASEFLAFSHGLEPVTSTLLLWVFLTGFYTVVALGSDRFLCEVCVHACLCLCVALLFQSVILIMCYLKI